MGVQLRPQQSFTVVRQIANHLDAGTYYVQAVIRNAYTDAVLATLNLEDRGSQRFSKNWQVTADPSGQGLYVSIVTSVYTDSGYTTKSENYGDEENTHLVAELPTSGRFGGGGGIDSGTLRRIVKEELEKVKPEPIEIPEQEKSEMRWGDVLSAIGYVQDLVEKIPTQKVDITPILTSLSEISRQIEEKEVTPATDLAPVLESLERVLNEINAIDGEQRLILEDHMKQLREELPGMIDENAGSAVSRAKFSLNMPFGVNVDGMNEKPKTEGQPFDINKFTQ